MKVVSRGFHKSSAFILVFGSAVAVVLCVYMVSSTSNKHSTRCYAGPSAKAAGPLPTDAQRLFGSKGTLTFVAADGRPVYLTKTVDSYDQQSGSSEQTGNSVTKEQGKNIDDVDALETAGDTGNRYSSRTQNKPKSSPGGAKKFLITTDSSSSERKQLNEANAPEISDLVGQSKRKSSIDGSKRNVITVETKGVTSSSLDRQDEDSDDAMQQETDGTNFTADKVGDRTIIAKERTKSTQQKKDAETVGRSGEGKKVLQKQSGFVQEERSGQFTVAQLIKGDDKRKVQKIKASKSSGIQNPNIGSSDQSEVPKKVPLREFCEEDQKKKKYEVDQHNDVYTSELPPSVINNVKKFILFVGYPRSGHSIVGSLLDAHPNMVVSNSYAVFKQMLRDPNSHQSRAYLFNGIYRNSFCNFYFGLRTANASVKGYSLRVENSWQANYNETIYAIGDKSGGNTVSTYEHNNDQKFLELYKQLMVTVGVPIRIIHAVRNPYDNIATMAIMDTNSGVSKLDLDPSHLYKNQKLLDACIDTYFRRARAAQEIFTLLNLTGKVIEMHSSDLVRKPKKTFAYICDRIGVTCTKEFLDIVANKVFPEVSKTRLLVKWTPAQVARVANEMKKFSFHQRYTFDTD